MIFVTLGTQDKSFKRLLDILEIEIEKELIKDEVIVQAGHTKFNSKYMTILDYVKQEDFEKYIENCNFLISHGGVGSIITALKKDKKVLVMPRLSKYKEQHNDHQLEIVEVFTEKGYILSFEDEKTFEEEYYKLEKFKPKKYRSNTKNMIQLIKGYIDNN